MSLISRLESRFGRWAIPNITAIIIAGQVLLYVLQMTRGMQVNVLEKIHLFPSEVLQGEIWRLVTFLFVPPVASPIWAFFYWFIMFRFGTGLEQIWGTFRYNIFLLVGFLANVIASFVAYAFGYLDFADNVFLYSTIFLAFARLVPDYTILIFFVLPIKIKWLALLMWIGYAYGMLTGDWMGRILIVASVANYLVFFGREHVRDLKNRHRRRAFESKVKAAANAIRHQCEVCDLNSENSPKTLFRYCSKCEGQRCYCPEHIHDHEHVTS